MRPAAPRAHDARLRRAPCGSLLAAFLLATLFAAARGSNQQECYNDNGITYQGTASSDLNGLPCLSWSSSVLTNLATSLGRTDLAMKLTAIQYGLQKLDGTANHSYCRNILNTGTKPWCYTIYTGPFATSWGYCDVPLCSAACTTPYNPCKNGGTCSVSMDQRSYSCSCSSAFSGVNCDGTAAASDYVNPSWIIGAAVGGSVILAIVILVVIIVCCIKKSANSPAVVQPVATLPTVVPTAPLAAALPAAALPYHQYPLYDRKPQSAWNNPYTYLFGRKGGF